MRRIVEWVRDNVLGEVLSLVFAALVAIFGLQRGVEPFWVLVAGMLVLTCGVLLIVHWRRLKPHVRKLAKPLAVLGVLLFI